MLKRDRTTPINRIRRFTKNYTILAFKTSKFTCSQLLHRAVRSHMFTVTAMSSSVSEVQLLISGRIVVNNNHAARSIVSTFTRTSKLRQWDYFRCIADVICVDVSIINDGTSTIAKLVF